MNQIELITGLPDWHWKDHSNMEIALTGQQLVDMSDFVWRVGVVAVVGFIHNSYTSPPWMWFVLAEGVTIRDLIDFRRLEKQIPKGTLTAVDINFPPAMRFAQLYNFEQLPEYIHRNDHTYQLMRKK